MIVITVQKYIKDGKIAGFGVHEGVKMRIRSLFFLAFTLAILGMVIACKDPHSSPDTVTYTVKFEANGGSPAPQSQSINKGDKIAEPAAMTQTGYGFAGWYKEAAFIKLWNFDNDTVTGKTTLYAKWDSNYHTVSFVANGGNPAPPPQNIAHGSKAVKPQDMSKGGFSFEGWYKEATFINLWNFNSDTVTENLVLYAKWEYLVPLTTVSVPGTTLAQKLQWIAANAASNTNYLLEVNADEPLNPYTLSYSGRSNIYIQLTGIGGVKTIELYGSGSLFTTEYGVTLVLNENIILKGTTATTNNAPLVTVSGGNLILNDGSKITGNSNNNYDSPFSYGGGVYVKSGTFTMYGGEISGNSSSYYSGGGVYVGSETFTMYGGKISGNNNSGVYVANGIFTMNGGEISGNTSSSGGGVYVGNGAFTMTGGEISGNTSSSSYSSGGGGGVYVGTGNNARFEKTGGIITSYTSDMENGNRSNSMGQAVYAEHSDSRFVRRKEFTAGPQDNLIYIRNEPAPPTIGGKWDHTVNFNLDGGSSGGILFPYQPYITYGNKIIEPPNITKTGYIFAGWYTEADYIKLWNFDNDTVTENITLYAKWADTPVPEAPGAPVITAGNGSLTVQWTAVEWALYYEVWRGTTNDSANAQQIYGYVSGTLTSYTFSSSNGTTYYVWLKARNNAGTSNFSPMASGKPIGNMGTVTVTTGGSGQLVVSWSAVAGADEYEVYYNTSNSIPASPTQTVSATTATISGLTNGTTYYFWVKPKNTNGTGNTSTAVNGRPIATPGNLTVIAANQQITVSWDSVLNATSYGVYYDTNPTIPASSSFTGTGLSRTITGLTNGTTYYFWVKAISANGTGAASPMASGKPIGNMGTVTVTTGGSGQLVLSWVAVAGADEYEVYHNTSYSIPASPAQTVSATTATINGLTNGTTYYVWVKPKNANGAGGTSAVASGKSIGNMGNVTLVSGNGQFALSWSTVAGADEYEVYYSASNSIPASPTQTVSTTTATINGLTNEITYYVWVKPKNANGSGGTSTVVSGILIIAAPPSNLTISGANQQITVSWDSVLNATSYEVYYSQSATIPASPSFTVTETSKTITGLTNGTTYYFWVKTVNDNGTGAASPVASGKPVGNMGIVTLNVGGSGQLVLSWSAVAGADQYEVYYSTSNSIPASPAQTVTTTTATVSELTNGTTYYVWVKPKNANGAGETSTVTSGVPIVAPGNLTLSTANQQITVSWAAVSGANSYEVYYSQSATIPASPSFTVTETSRTITGLTNGTIYYFWVKAMNANGTSAASPMASGKPIGNMGTVTVGVFFGSGQLVLSWSAVAGADEYEVYHNTSSSIPATPTQTVSSTTATISGLTNGTTYYIWVKPKNANGTGNASTAVNGRPLGTPGAPTVTPGFKQLQITWTAVPGAVEYEVYYGTGTTPTTLAATTTGNTATITGLTNSTTYYVRLRAKNANGVSDYGPNASNSTISISVTPGLYRGTERIGNQNLSTSLSYISSNAVSGDDFYIVLGADESTPPMDLNYSGKAVGIMLIGYGGERTITPLTSNRIMFTINSGVTLTLDENITLMGLSTNTTSLVSLNSGYLVINAGAKISGNNNPTGTGGGINVGGGTFIINGGTISGNTARGGGIFVQGGTVTMYGGTISGNRSNNQGGGVEVISGTFTMYGGVISGNTASTYGGGIYVNPSATFKKLPNDGGQNSGIIYGSEETGVDADGAPLRNTPNAVSSSSNRTRNTTAGQTDQIDTTTGRGLSTSGNPPYGQ